MEWENQSIGVNRNYCVGLSFGPNPSANLVSVEMIVTGFIKDQHFLTLQGYL